MAPKDVRSLLPRPSNMLGYGAVRMKVADGIRSLFSWPGDGEVVLDGPGGSRVITGSLQVEGGGGRWEEPRSRKRGLGDAPLLTWKRRLWVKETEAVSWGVQAAWKPNEMRPALDPRSSRKDGSPADTQFWTSATHVGFLIPRTIRWKICVAVSHSSW